MCCPIRPQDGTCAQIAIPPPLALLCLRSACSRQSSHAATDAEEVEEIAEPTRSVCAVYYPQRCWYHLSDPGQPPEVPPCASAQECSFGLVACPVWETGTFDSIETEVCGP
jgi:hypothetical protein